MRLRTMAEFYRATHWTKEPEEGIYCRVSIKGDPLVDNGYVGGDKINREINSIIKRFKNDPELLKETEKSYYRRQQLDEEIKDSDRKRLIVKRVFSYEYENLLYQLYKPTAKEEFGRWRTEGMRRDEIIKGISDIKSISSNEAEKLFNTFLDHDLIWYFGCKYCLTPMLENESSGWDIISSSDMNFQKWMIKSNI